MLDLVSPSPIWSISRCSPLFPHGWWYYVRACDIADLNDDVIDIMVEHGDQIVSPVSSIALWQMGGALPRVEQVATAFNGRDAAFTFNINGNGQTADGFDAERDGLATVVALSPTTPAST